MHDRLARVGKMRAFGTVRTLASGRYQARYWHLGQRVAAPTPFTTKADANAWLSAVETDVRRGEHLDPRAGSERFAAYARRWIDERDLKARTRETYESQRNSGTLGGQRRLSFLLVEIGDPLVARPPERLLGAGVSHRRRTQSRRRDPRPGPPVPANSDEGSWPRMMAPRSWYSEWDTQRWVAAAWESRSLRSSGLAM